MNNITVLDGKCPPGWSLLQDTCYMYIGAPMTFHEARTFCRSDNASLPFIRGDTTELWLYLQRQMTHLKYPEKVWIQDLNYLEQCTSFIYRSVDIEPCNTKRGFVCEIDPRVSFKRKINYKCFSHNFHFRLLLIRYLGKPILLQSVLLVLLLQL